MGRLVLKFGGTSVADIERIRNVARHVAREVAAGHEVAVVVSAMSGTTDQLVGWVNLAAASGGANRVSADMKEHDAVVASGEQVTAGLLAIVLQSMGLKARSWAGWQVPMLTSDSHGAARILDVDCSAMIAAMADGQVAVMAGFQGISSQGARYHAGSWRFRHKCCRPGGCTWSQM